MSGKESFDLILYNSTKGEHWYMLVFSKTDIQRRQGKKYNFSFYFDLIADYDKRTNYKYYKSNYNYIFGKQVDEVLTFKREVTELTAWVNNGMAKNLILQFGIRYKRSKSFDYDSLAESSIFASSTHTINSPYVKLFSLLSKF